MTDERTAENTPDFEFLLTAAIFCDESPKIPDIQTSLDAVRTCRMMLVWAAENLDRGDRAEIAAVVAAGLRGDRPPPPPRTGAGERVTGKPGRPDGTADDAIRARSDQIVADLGVSGREIRHLALLVATHEHDVRCMDRQLEAVIAAARGSGGGSPATKSARSGSRAGIDPRLHELVATLAASLQRRADQWAAGYDVARPEAREWVKDLAEDAREILARLVDAAPAPAPESGSAGPSDVEIGRRAGRFLADLTARVGSGAVTMSVAELRARLTGERPADAGPGIPDEHDRGVLASFVHTHANAYPETCAALRRLLAIPPRPVPTRASR